MADKTGAARIKKLRAEVKLKLNRDGWSSLEKWMTAYKNDECEIVRAKPKKKTKKIKAQ